MYIAQLVRALHRNRRAAGSIPATGPVVAFFATLLVRFKIVYNLLLEIFNLKQEPCTFVCF